MAKTHVLDKTGSVRAEIDLPAEIFEAPVNAHLLYEAAVNYEANQRRGTATTKTRAEVTGSNRKPWRQKGTGRARAGATRNPLWRKGGTTFGPRPKDYGYSLPRQAKRIALRSAVAAKQAEGRMRIIDDLTIGGPKTKEGAALIKGLKVRSALIVDARENAALFTALRNIPRVQAADWRGLTPHAVLNHQWLVLSRQAFESLVEKLK